jgi:hypothetical protein
LVTLVIVFGDVARCRVLHSLRTDECILVHHLVDIVEVGIQLLGMLLSLLLSYGKLRFCCSEIILARANMEWRGGH